jgi:hypothetical protein
MKLASIIFLISVCFSDLAMAFRSVSRARFSSVRSNVRMLSEEQDFRTFAHYGIYKGKGAINVKPIAPTFKIGEKSQIVEREGSMLFEFAPAGTGPRDYDWSKKSLFSLSATECAEIVRLKETGTIEFTHDPHAGSKFL